MKHNEITDLAGIRPDSQTVVKQALSFQRPDRIPVFDGSFWDEFVDRWRQEKALPATAAIEDYYGNDLKVLVAREEFFPSQVGPVRSEGQTVYLNDGWGRIVRTNHQSHFSETVEQFLREPADLDTIRFEPADGDLRYQTLISQATEHQRKGRAVFIKVGGPFIRSSFFRGEGDFLADLAGDESFAQALVEKVADHLTAIGLESLKRINAYEYGVWIYDDMCSLRGPMFSPATFERIFLPVYQKMVAAFKSAGARWVILHCDGNIAPFLDLLLTAGIDGINPVEPAAGMAVERLLAKYHGRLFFIGGVCNTHILPGGDPEAISRHVRTVRDAGRNGGLVIGTHSIGPDIATASFEHYRKLVSENH